MNKVPSEMKDYKTIWSHIQQSLEIFGFIENDLKKGFSISDEGANVKKCLRIFNGKSMVAFKIGIMIND